MEGKLEGECRENSLKIASVLGTPRAEEAGSELSVRESHFSECLGNGRFSGPGQAIQPEDALLPFIRQPMFNLPEDTLPRSPQAPLPVPTTKSSVWGMVKLVEKGAVGRSLSIG